MSCFRLPRWLIDRIDSIRRNFLWTRPSSPHAIHLLNWTTACLPISCGGLGIVNLQLQNTSLLLRWLWRIFIADHKLWRMYALQLYALPNTDFIPNSNPVPTILTSIGSFFWRLLINLRPLFHSCSQFEVASGKGISFWFDGWAGQPLKPANSRTLPQRNISLFRACNIARQLLLPPHTLQMHLAIQKIDTFQPLPGLDRLRWTLSSTGNFTVKSVYKVLSEARKTRSLLIPIWRTKTTPSMRLLFFLMLNNRLLTHDVMIRRNMPFTPGCVLCSGRSPETLQHLFFQCEYAARVWSILSTSVGLPMLCVEDTPIRTYMASAPASKANRSRWLPLFISTAWFLWRERNARVFRQDRTSPHILAVHILQETALCSRFC